MIKQNCQDVNLAIRKIAQMRVWEDFMLRISRKTFLNSWSWGEFQKRMRERIWRIGVYNDGQLAAAALAVKVSAKRGSFLLVPHGPIVDNQNENLKSKILGELVHNLKGIAKQERCSFIRISPIWERNEKNAGIFHDLGFRKAPIQTHPEASWKLDITRSEQELLMSMRKTTRYLIRQAQANQDIEVFQTQKLEDLDVFSKLHKEVSRTQRFIPFSLKYLKNEFIAFSENNSVSLFFGKYKGEVAAASFVLFWSGIGFYHHAALLPKYRKIPVSYLLQWEAIKEAKKRGCALYDFWGYTNNPKHPWYGPTLFKMGFGGYADEYVKTQDLVLSPRYWFNYAVETMRRLKRGL